MNRVSLVLCLAVGLLLLGGCAVQYSHPSAPQSLWDTDYHRCVVEADYAVVFHHYSTVADDPDTSRFLHYSPRYRKFIRQCMADKGYEYDDSLKTVLFGKP